MHSKWNQGRRGTSQVDDECAEELVSMLDLISNVLNRDVLDFSNETSNDKTLVAASDVSTNIYKSTFNGLLSRRQLIQLLVVQPI